MKDSFPDFLQQHGFTREQALELNRASTRLELAAKTAITRQGDVAEFLYFMVKGLCHACYHTNDGKTFSKEFYWQGDFLINFESLIKQEPSPYSLETLSPSLLISIPVTQIQQWRKLGHPFYLHLLENQLLHKENKERFMLLHGPKERYQLFSKRFPELESRLTDYQVASYIGITPISLSRIKKRLGS